MKSSRTFDVNKDGKLTIAEFSPRWPSLPSRITCPMVRTLEERQDLARSDSQNPDTNRDVVVEARLAEGAGPFPIQQFTT